jgi:carboxylesterase 2
VSTFENAGAYHTSEIPSVFGTYPLSSSGGNVTPAQIALSKYMRGEWTDFAKNPTAGPGFPAIGTNWGFELQNYGPDGSSTGKLQSLLSVDLACPLYNVIDLAMGLGY